MHNAYRLGVKNSHISGYPCLVYSNVLFGAEDALLFEHLLGWFDQFRLGFIKKDPYVQP